MDNEEAKLSPAMIHVLEVTGLDDIMAGGPTRAALMRRGLVYGGDRRGRFGYFTEDGRALAARLQDEKKRSQRPVEAEQKVEMFEGVNDLDKVKAALIREYSIRHAMAETGEDRQTVTDAMDALSSMGQEAVLSLMDGEPTTLADGLQAYIETLDQAGREDETLAAADVLDALHALLAYPWPGEVDTLQP